MADLTTLLARYQEACGDHEDALLAEEYARQAFKVACQEYLKASKKRREAYHVQKDLHNQLHDRN